MNRTHIGIGLFVIGTVGLLLWLAHTIGALGTGGGHRYTLRLGHAAGLVQNNAVKVAGVQVGFIEAIGVDHDVAVLRLRIDRDVVLHDDATAIVRAKSLLGEKYLQLEPGQREAPVLPDGGEIVDVRTPFEIDEVLNALQPILGSEDSLASVVEPLVSTLDALLGDAAGRDGRPPIITREEIRQIIEDTKATAAAARRIAEHSEKPVVEIVDRTRALVADPRIGRTMQRIDALTQTLDERVPALLERADATLARLEQVAAVVDDDRARKLRAIIDDGHATMASLRKLSSELEGTSGKIDPLLRDLSTIADRATEVDEAAVRRFLQQEGVKIYVGNRRAAARALEE